MLLLLCLQLQADPLADLAHPDSSRRLKALETVYRGSSPAQLPRLLPLLGDPQLRIRIRTAEALRNHPDLLLRALKLPSPLARLHACRVAGKDLEDAVAERLSDPDARVRSEAAKALKSPAAASRLAELVRRDPDSIVRAHAFEALAPAEALALLPTAAKDSQAPLRQIAAERAAALGDPSVLEALLADRDWRVRSTAIASLPRTREAVGWLIARMDKEDSRLQVEVLRRLESISGKDLGPEPRPWRDWWAVNRETFTPSGTPGAPANSVPQTQAAAFFDIPVSSTRALFVLDLSGSMREPAPGGAGSKLDAAKQGMLATLRALPASARFGILGLGCNEDGDYVDRDKKTWGGRLQLRPASPAAKADAERFVRGLEARGWTNLYDGLELALTDPEADTIFLYSDGGASKGALVATAEILEELRRRNRFQRIQIHTVEVPGERNPADNRRLLAEIAAATGGRCSLHEAPRPKR